MNVLGQMLDDREERRSGEEAADDIWLRERAGIDPAERRAAWRRWLRKELEKTLRWPANEAVRERLVGQCAAEITVLARQLRGRGWLLEGKALAEHVRALLRPIAAAQRAGKVRDFWPYFGEAVSRYVGAHAEEIQAHARRSGADEAAQTMGAVMAALGVGGVGKQRPASMTEVLAERDDEVRRAKAAREATDKAQMRLL